MSTESIKEKERTSSESKPSKAHPNWGGKRKGAGRKPLTDRAFGSTILIRVSDEQKEYFRQKGASSWVRSLMDKDGSINCGFQFDELLSQYVYRKRQVTG